MIASDFTTTLFVDQSPEEVFSAINTIERWWTENFEGRSHTVGDEFTVQFPGIHVSTQKVVELIPAQKISWLVTDSTLSSFEDEQEWTGTTIHFTIAKQGNKTQIDFTHVGLVPEVACYHSCTKGWTYFIDGSLFRLFTTGKGNPGLKLEE